MQTFPHLGSIIPSPVTPLPTWMSLISKHRQLLQVIFQRNRDLLGLFTGEVAEVPFFL